MPIITAEQITEKFEKLPEDLKAALASADFEKSMQVIGGKYGLHVDTLGLLMTETNMLMLGFTHPNDFVQKVKDHLGLPEDKVTDIVGDINDLILRPIKDSLMKIHSEPAEYQQEALPAEAPRPFTQEEIDALIKGEPKEAELETGPTDNLQQTLDVKEEEVLRKTGIEFEGMESHFEEDKLLEEKKEREKIVEMRPVQAEPANPVSVTLERNVIEEKMSGAFRLPPEISEQTLPNISKTAEVERHQAIDPYRETTR
jgi:hypothetical protein